MLTFRVLPVLGLALGHREDNRRCIRIDLSVVLHHGRRWNRTLIGGGGDLPQNTSPRFGALLSPGVWGYIQLILVGRWLLASLGFRRDHVGTIRRRTWALLDCCLDRQPLLTNQNEEPGRPLLQEYSFCCTRAPRWCRVYQELAPYPQRKTALQIESLSPYYASSMVRHNERYQRTRDITTPF